MADSEGQRDVFDDADLGGLDFVEALGRAFEAALSRVWPGGLPGQQAQGAAPPDHMGQQGGGAPIPPDITPTVGSEGQAPGLRDVLGSARGVAGSAAGVLGPAGGAFAALDSVLAKVEQVMSLVERFGDLSDVLEKFFAPDVEEVRPREQPLPEAIQMVDPVRHGPARQLGQGPGTGIEPYIPEVQPYTVSVVPPKQLEHRPHLLPGPPEPPMPGWFGQPFREHTGGKTHLAAPGEMMADNAPPAGFDPFASQPVRGKQGPGRDFWASQMSEGHDLAMSPGFDLLMPGERQGGRTAFDLGTVGGDGGQGQDDKLNTALERLVSVLEAFEGVGGMGGGQGGGQGGVPNFTMGEGTRPGGMLPGPASGLLPGGGQGGGEDMVREKMLDVGGRLLGNVLSTAAMAAAAGS